MANHDGEANFAECCEEVARSLAVLRVVRPSSQRRNFGAALAAAFLRRRFGAALAAAFLRRFAAT